MKKTKKIDNESGKPAKKKRSFKKIAVITLSVLVLVPTIGIGVSVIGFKIWAKDVNLDTSLLPTATALPSFYNANGQKLEYISDSYIAQGDIPNDLKSAFVSLEDKRFYKHKGYDPVRISGALIANLKHGKVKEGASTITQQLVKNTHLTQARTFDRKLHEIAIAEKLEKQYSKDEILAMYMSVIYFGGGAYGVNAASRLYFGKTPDKLTLAECATLAGIVKNPSKYSPKNSKTNATARRNLVLDEMLQNNAISSEQCAVAKDEEIVLSNKTDDLGANKYYIDRAVEEVTSALGITKYQLNNSGYKIYTALDTSLQKCLAEEAANKANFSANSVDSEAIVLDNKSGAVQAHCCSLQYKISRQAGSTLKPIAVFAPALERGVITLATSITDEKTSFGGYSPNNYGGVYYGETTPREAIKKSMNSVAVKTMDYLGIDNSYDYVERFGIPLSSSDKNYALALGATSKGVRPISLAAAYSAFANGGEKASPHYVTAVIKNDTKIYSSAAPTDASALPLCGKNSSLLGSNLPIYSSKFGSKTLDYDSNPSIFGSNSSLHCIISPETAYLITSALLDTVKDGTARGLSYLPYQIAAKTGTASTSGGKNTDAWNVGYTTQNTVLVWHGAETMTETGGAWPTRHAANIWQRMYKNGEYPSNFTAPGGIKEVELDTYSSKINNQLTKSNANTPEKYKKTEYFSIDNMPYCDNSCFGNIEPTDFELKLNGKQISISFRPQEIYTYTIYRTDARGKSKIYTIDTLKNDSKSNNSEQNGSHPIELTDTPLSIGGVVQYTIVAELSPDFQNGQPKQSSSATKSIYIDIFHN